MEVFLLETMKISAGELAQWLRAFLAVAKDLGLILSVHNVVLRCTCKTLIK